ncbi:MAG: hypothetical protein ACI4ON_00420 [Clostridia bacterium]
MEAKFKVKHKFKKIDNFINKLPRVVEESIEDILKNIQVNAIRLERGHNQDGILIEIVNVSTKEIKGRIYADPDRFIAKDADGKEAEYLFYEYFGTGAYAEMEHVGNTTHFKETGYTEWYIPKNKVLRPLSYPIKVINGHEFYVATGAQSNHFLENAEFKTRNQNIQVFNSKIKEFIEEVCK